MRQCTRLLQCAAHDKRSDVKTGDCRIMGQACRLVSKESMWRTSEILHVHSCSITSSVMKSSKVMSMVHAFSERSSTASICKCRSARQPRQALQCHPSLVHQQDMHALMDTQTRKLTCRAEWSCMQGGAEAAYPSLRRVKCQTGIDGGGGCSHEEW